MGNSVSLLKDSNSKEEMDRPSRAVVNPPSGWRDESNHQHFQLVSPMSDLSNPSQQFIVHRNNNKTNMTQQTPTTERRRRSKGVMSKTQQQQRRHHHSLLPPPTQFYFPTAASERHYDKKQQQQLRLSQDAQIGLTHDDNNDNNNSNECLIFWKNRRQVMRQKVARVKTLLTSCWEERNKLDCIVVQQSSHERLHDDNSKRLSADQRVSRKSLPQQQPAAVPHVEFHPPDVVNVPSNQEEEGDLPFEPVWREASVDNNANVYLHNQDDYLDRIVDKTNSTSSSSPSIEQQQQAVPNNNEELPLESPVVALLERYNNENAADTTKMARELRVQRLSGGSSRSSNDKAYQFTLDATDQDKKDILQESNNKINAIQPSQKDTKKKRDDPKKVRYHFTVDRKSIEEQIQAQIDTQLEERRNNKKEQPKGRRSSSTSQQEPKAGKESVPRVERLRQQYQREIERLSASSTKKKQEAGRSTRETRSRRRRRSSSSPPEKKQQQTQPSKNGRRRSSSVPPRKEQKPAIPVLLQLAGWQDKHHKKTTKQQQELPALLQLAGWDAKKTNNNKKPKRVTDPGPIKVRFEGVTKDAPKRKSEPLPKVRFESSTTSKQVPSIKQESQVTSVVKILQQTYPLMASFGNEEKVSSAATDYRTIALGNNSSPTKTNIQQSGVSSSSSPTMSIDSQDSRASQEVSCPLVSEQAMNNAAFLFAEKRSAALPNNKDHHHHAFAISTFDSRSRVSSRSVPTTTLSIDEVPKETAIRVQFSSPSKSQQQSIVVEKPGSVEIPAIEQTLSDITDNDVGGRESSLVVSGPTVSPVQEEPYKNNELVESVVSDDVIQIFEDTSKDDDSSQKVMNWSYAAEGGLADNGVTPLRSGRSTNHATNSPYLRFKEAKKRFTTTTTTASQQATTKVPPVKRSSPVKHATAGLVASRLAEMERRTASSKTTATTRVVTRKARRATTGHKVLAPHKATLKSSVLQMPVEHNKEVDLQQEESDTSPTFVGGQLVSSPRRTSFKGFHEKERTIQQPETASIISDSSSSSSKDGHQLDDNIAAEEYESQGSMDSAFGRIMHPTTIDEDSEPEEAQRVLKTLFSGEQSFNRVEDSDCTDDESEDEFADIMNSQSMDEDTFTVETVSTVRQDKGRMYGSSRSSTSHGSSTVRRDRGSMYGMGSSRSSTSDGSTVRSSLSSTVAPSVATVRQQKPPRQSLTSIGESSTLSSLAGKTEPLLPFREEAPVKPNEQNPRTAPGALCLSPMQRTPMQARKWRALAAAAQEKDSKRDLVGKKNKQTTRGRKSLSERNPNVIGR